MNLNNAMREWIAQESASVVDLAPIDESTAIVQVTAEPPAVVGNTLVVSVPHQFDDPKIVLATFAPPWNGQPFDLQMLKLKSLVVRAVDSEIGVQRVTGFNYAYSPNMELIEQDNNNLISPSPFAQQSLCKPMVSGDELRNVYRYAALEGSYVYNYRLFYGYLSGSSGLRLANATIDGTSINFTFKIVSPNGASVNRKVYLRKIA